MYPMELDAETVEELGYFDAEDDPFDSESDLLGLESSEDLLGLDETDSEFGYDDAESRRRRAGSRAQARSRARTLARARSRQANMRRSTARSAPRTVAQAARSNRTAIQKVDLDNKVTQDLAARALGSQSTRVSGLERSLASSKVLEQAIATFPEVSQGNAYLKAGVPLASLLLLRPTKRGSGFSSVASDPRIWGPALVAGLIFIGDKRRKQQAEEEELNDVVSIDLENVPQELAAGDATRLKAVLRSASGRLVPLENIKFESVAPPLANAAIDEKSGEITTQAGNTGLLRVKVVYKLDGKELEDTAIINVK